MNSREAARQRLAVDFPFYAGKCLKIRTKAGKVAPLVLNRAQLYVHGRLEEQRVRTGMVRALVLKGRQQGMSTYIGARFYHKTTHRRGCKTMILAHMADATSNLFKMVNRYHDNCPGAVRPHTRYSSKKELVFDRLDSGYALGTAGSGSTGRSDTVQLLHGSEVAFWNNASELASGVLQTVPNTRDTEIIFESTANGVGGFFHGQWKAAEAGASDYIAVFVPWFWQPEYRKPVPHGFVLTDEEREYMDLYDLDFEQMAWRRSKIVELGDPLLFKQEYPATPVEAFEFTGTDSYIPTSALARARKHVVVEPWGPVVAGVDPARFGDDSTCIAVRQGRKISTYQRHHGLDTMQVAGRCRVMLDRHEPRIDKMFIDVGGLGAGVYDRLKEMGYGDRVTPVNFGGAPMDQRKYRNKRAEMWGLSREWVVDEDLPADVTDCDDLHADAIAPGYEFDSMGRLVLEPKEKIRKRGLPSPDGWDAVALTFAYPVRADAARQQVADAGARTFMHQPTPSSGGLVARQGFAD